MRDRRPRSRIAVALAGFTAFAAFAAAGAGAGAQEVDPPPAVEASRQLTVSPQPARLLVTPAIAVHPDDPLTMAVATGDVRNGGCGLRVSRDGGLSWSVTESLMPPDLPHCIQRNHGSALQLAWASDGTLYMAMSGSSVETTPPHPNGPITPLLARTRDLGATHDVFRITTPETKTYTLRDGTQAEGVEQHKNATIAVDPDDPDVVYRGWRLQVRGVDQAPVPGWALGNPDQGIALRSMLAVSTDGGRTWGEPIDLTDQLGEEVFGADVPSLVVSPDGTLHAFVRESPDRASDATPRLFVASSSDRGQTWSAHVMNEGAARIGLPVATVDPSNGNLYAVWESQGDSRDNPSNVFFTASTDGGATWTEPLDVTDDDPARQASQYMPGIGVAPDGRIDLAWHDFRDDPFFSPGEDGTPARYSSVYYAYSTDGGRTFSDNIRITDRLIDRTVGVTFNNQDIRSPLAVASTEYAALLAWPDSRAGDPTFEAEDVYFTRVRFEPSPLGATAGSDVVPFLAGAAAALVVAGVALALGLWAARSGRPAVGPGRRQPEPTPTPGAGR